MTVPSTVCVKTGRGVGVGVGVEVGVALGVGVGDELDGGCVGSRV